MISWIQHNFATIIIVLVLAGIVAGIIICRIRNKKKGMPSCGCGCSKCSMSEHCGKKQ